MFNVSFIYGLLIGRHAPFAVQAARSDPVRFAFYPGRGVRSRKLRSQTELRILEESDNSGGFMILIPHAVLVVGNMHSLPKSVQDIESQVLILDFCCCASTCQLGMAAEVTEEREGDHEHG